ncbi:CD48 antigen isoform X2 [Plectropomus leopardus]|uniref:CD48 antigen isoform X2 n=1 Tax=Plectropomus leopardus TaxID=160734 RepID=UPI001C4C8E45|nr:CD48 antigen isoform X2 [Plectropomus leopardus]XP_042367950.1 CD48 antigen isoform X2 [Plectropomus leopardus]XP_042367951.1 CD48 antigen isoform X2 [Plectropomus leopardus]
MKLQILLTLILQVALAESLRERYGYFGDTITLPSEADKTWTIASVVWSIFSNNTWIATFNKGVKNEQWTSRYKGRISLNTSSGDLTIRNLTTEDNMEYTVDLLNTVGQNSADKIKLTVRQRLQKPTIETVTSSSVKGGCWLFLRCLSADKDVNLSWQSEHSNVTVNTGQPDGNTSVLFTFLKTTQNCVNFTCTSSNKNENASSDITLKCDDQKPTPHPDSVQPRERNAVAFFLGGMLGGGLIAILLYFFGGKLFPSVENNVV